MAQRCPRIRPRKDACSRLSWPPPNMAMSPASKEPFAADANTVRRYAAKAPPRRREVLRGRSWLGVEDDMPEGTSLMPVPSGQAFRALHEGGLRLRVLALDYDGTIARRGTLNPDVRAALADVRARGIATLLVTGRRLDDLRAVAGDLGFADAVVG